MLKVYVVSGMDSYPSDYTVRAFTTKARAEEFAAECNAWRLTRPKSELYCWTDRLAHTNQKQIWLESSPIKHMPNADDLEDFQVEKIEVQG